MAPSPSWPLGLAGTVFRAGVGAVSGGAAGSVQAAVFGAGVGAVSGGAAGSVQVASSRAEPQAASSWAEPPAASSWAEPECSWLFPAALVARGAAALPAVPL